MGDERQIVKGCLNAVRSRPCSHIKLVIWSSQSYISSYQLQFRGHFATKLKNNKCWQKKWKMWKTLSTASLWVCPFWATAETWPTVGTNKRAPWKKYSPLPVVYIHFMSVTYYIDIEIEFVVKRWYDADCHKLISGPSLLRTAFVTGKNRLCHAYIWAKMKREMFGLKVKKTIIMTTQSWLILVIIRMTVFPFCK